MGWFNAVAKVGRIPDFGFYRGCRKAFNDGDKILSYGVALGPGGAIPG